MGEDGRGRAKTTATQVATVRLPATSYPTPTSRLAPAPPTSASPAMTQRVRVQVPGSTSNLGHGFDCMGMAVALHNRIDCAALDDDRIELPDDAPRELHELVGRIRADCAAFWGRDLPGLRLRVDTQVPLARGLGSSATLYLGIAAACQQLAGLTLDRAELIRLGVEWEGHPDNIVAACLGGFTVAADVGTSLRWQRIAIPDALQAVLASPDHEVSTADSRRDLPDRLDRSEAVRAWQRCSLLTAALANGDLDQLADLCDDAWHERHRATHNPGLSEARAAAKAAGALDCFLSGSGSTVLAWCCTDTAEAIAAALAESYQNLGISCTLRTVPFDNTGLTVSE